jgi:hypothetical protein
VEVEVEVEVVEERRGTVSFGSTRCTMVLASSSPEPSTLRINPAAATFCIAAWSDRVCCKWTPAKAARWRRR